MGQYTSDAQRRKFHAMENRGEISHAEVAKRDKASKGKRLPERVENLKLGDRSKARMPRP
jgi:hypothetical protein